MRRNYHGHVLLRERQTPDHYFFAGTYLRLETPWGSAKSADSQSDKAFCNGYKRHPWQNRRRRIGRLSENKQAEIGERAGQNCRAPFQKRNARLDRPNRIGNHHHRVDWEPQEIGEFLAIGRQAKISCFEACLTCQCREHLRELKRGKWFEDRRLKHFLNTCPELWKRAEEPSCVGLISCRRECGCRRKGQLYPSNRQQGCRS